MANERPSPVIIDSKGGKPWEFPDGLWQKIPALQAIRLRRTVNEKILPLLYQLDDMFPRAGDSKHRHIKGMSINDIESDISSTVLALHLFDIAIEMGLLKFANKGAKKGAKPGPKTPVGSCGMSIAEARRYFLEDAARNILKEAGHDPKKLHDMLGNYDLKDPSSLFKLKLMATFDPLTISELKEGLRGNMGKLFDCDEEFFRVLKKAKPTNFLRPLRQTLGKNFPDILEWDGTFIRAVAEGLEHSAKIIALGRSLLEIEDPEIARALGRWPIEEAVVKDKVKGKKKTYITRIEQVRKLLGDEFRILMKSNAAVIDQAGNWKDDEIERIKFFVGYINGEVIETLSELPFAYTVNIMEGLWSTVSREFMEEQLTTPEAISALKSIIAKIKQMGIDSTTPEKVKGMIENKFFDEQLSQFYK
ncbi:MAG: hypothetical protein HOL66_00305 [Rhodospirillaceae bacterium]|nr:hypothetical protein [Rhodospirillaceae bacterium]MBT5242664.1 hypothetical protein [Rhodospirillaceae bacterium]MBT5562827.1 hypothetical protein [Rhodospirillaceae bacterium]MBT6241256.1 hypothetical protein [Rhodospirillaceae bacterium]MBT7137105.1 hypothetical protein [Rhodospirillaceae bacterium]